MHRNDVPQHTFTKLTQKQKHVVRKEKEKKQNVQTPKLKYSSTTHSSYIYYSLHTHKKDSNEIVLFIYLVYIYVNTLFSY